MWARKSNAKRSWDARILAVLFIVGIVSGCVTTGEKGQDAVASTSLPAPQEIAADQSCGKCGMFPARYPKWQSQVIFKDGSMVPFDGCKCMFNYLFSKQDGQGDVAVVWVRDFPTGTWINGQDAHFVIGSGVMGPMGKELIPFADSVAAMEFHKKHGGEMAMFDSITPETMKPLMGHNKMGGHKSMMGGQHKM